MVDLEELKRLRDNFTAQKFGSSSQFTTKAYDALPALIAELESTRQQRGVAIAALEQVRNEAPYGSKARNRATVILSSLKAEAGHGTSGGGA